MFADIENKWTAYLAKLEDADLTRTFDYVRQGVRLRYAIEHALTQLNVHALYHRGQVESLVSRLGGRFMDTDFVFWHKPEELGDF